MGITAVFVGFFFRVLVFFNIHRIFTNLSIAPILTMLQTSVAELQLSILHHITVLTQLKPRLFSRDYKHFYLK